MPVLRRCSHGARPRCTPAHATSRRCGWTVWRRSSSTSPRPTTSPRPPRSCGDVTLLVNNAGIGTGTSALSADAIEMSKQEFDTNVLGPLAVTQAFAPILGANGGGSDRQRPVRAVMVQRAAIGAVLRGEGSLVVADELDPPRAALPAHPGGGGACRLHGHRHDRRPRCAEVVARRRRRCRSWTGWRRVTSRSLPTTSAGTCAAALSGDLTVLYPALAAAPVR